MSYLKGVQTVYQNEAGRELTYTLFIPENPPKAILHILPGLFEEADCAEKAGLVTYMTDAGFLVCCVSSGSTEEKQNGTVYSGLPDKKDVMLLYCILRNKYRTLPYVVFGFGTGSLVLRSILPEYGSEFDGCALCGTYTETAGTLTPLILAEVSSLLFGETHACKAATRFHNSRMNAICKASQNEPLSWLCSDAGDFCSASEPYLLSDGKPRTFSSGTMKQIYQMIRALNAEDAAEKIPRSLPVILLSGKEDSAGGMGEGIRLLYQELFEAELDDLQIKLYESCRHMLFFEPCREQLFSDLENWILGICRAKVQCNTLPLFRTSEAD